MKELMAFLVVLAVLGGLYYGYIFVVGKTMKSAPKTDLTESTALWQTESQKTADLKQQQRDLMRQRQDQMRDRGHR